MDFRASNDAPTGLNAVGVNDRSTNQEGDRRSDPRYDRSQISFSARSRPLSPISEHVIDIDAHGRRFSGEQPESSLRDGTQPWASGEPYHHPIPQKEDPWNECFKLVLKFDEEMCRGWREEIDTLLVFAGLFSAAVTAFTIVSYTWLQPDPQVIQVELLQQIVSQLTSIQNGAINTTANASAVAQDVFIPSASSVRVNVFWFASLTLSLSAVLVGILCKQWLREYQRYEGLSAKDAFPVRQLRYEGLLGWHVPKILSALPLLLQGALVLFFAGLLDLLWGINTSVAIFVTAIVGLTMAMLVWTTIMPCIQNIIHLSKNWTFQSRVTESGPQCAFKSPQSWAFYLLVTWIISTYSQIKQYLFYGTSMTYLQVQLTSWHSKEANWVKYDYRWQTHGKFVQRGLRWFDKTFARGGYNLDAIYSVFGCMESLELPISAECVSNVIEENWHPLLPVFAIVQNALEPIYRPTVDNIVEVIPDISADLILASYLLVHHKASPTISSRCLEHCTRMLSSPSITKELALFVLEALDILNLSSSEPAASQLMTSLSNLFKHDLISVAEIPRFWNILTDLLRVSQDSAKENSRSLRSLDFLLRHVEVWLVRVLKSPETTDFDRRLAVSQCSVGIWEVCRLLKVDSLGSVEPEGELSKRFQTLSSFIRILDETLLSLGGPHSILSMWSAENWIQIRQIFLQEVIIHNEDEKETDEFVISRVHDVSVE